MIVTEKDPKGWDPTRTATGLNAILAEMHVAWGKLLDAASQIPDPPRRDWCWTCSGNGRYWEDAGNGEGRVPRTCPTCQGSGAS